MPKLGNDVYNFLKWVALIGLPAAGTLYFALAAIWGWPDADKVVGSVTALDMAMGVMLNISSSKFYQENTVAIIKQPGGAKIPGPAG